MKRILLFMSVLVAGTTFAQNSNAVFFSENGERFFVVINGLQQNDKAETNVKLTGLNPTNYKVKILFENSTNGKIDKNIFLEDYKEYTFQIKKNPKPGTGDLYVLKAYSINEVAYKSKPAPIQSTGYSSQPSTTTTTTTQSTTIINPPPTSGQISMSINLGTGGGNLGMNVNESSYEEHSTTTTTTHTEQQHYIMPGYNGNIGCSWPMSDADFNAAKQSISSKSFDDSRMTMAKQIINTNCLFSKQVREIMTLFSFENTKLEFAKYAYGYTYDLGNYFKVNDAFTFESSIDELNSYIEHQK